MLPLVLKPQREVRVWVGAGCTAHHGKSRQAQMASRDPDSQEVIPEETASLLDWGRATVRSVYPDQGDFLSPPVNPRWKTPTEEADVFHTQATWDRLYDDRDIHPVNTLISQVTVNTVVKGAPFTRAPCVPYGCKTEKQSGKPYPVCSLSFPIVCLTDANKNNRFINKSLGGDRGESQRTLPTR